MSNEKYMKAVETEHNRLFCDGDCYRREYETPVRVRKEGTAVNGDTLWKHHCTMCGLNFTLQGVIATCCPRCCSKFKVPSVETGKGDE